jgi:Zn-dependent peptidase ImmA (M78 family)
MGARGNRMITSNTVYSEPDLMKGIDDLLRQARENGCYDGDKLDVKKLVDYVSTTNPNEPITLIYVQMEPATSGSLTFEEGTWIIRVNKNHNSKRQRFTILHELGHYILHRNKLQSFTDEIFFRAGVKGDIEYRANEFASKLLMPEDYVRKAIAEGVRNLGLLAERFDVSSPAMKIRVQELGYKLKQND